MPLSKYGVLKCTTSFGDNDAKASPPSNVLKIVVRVGDIRHFLELPLGTNRAPLFRCQVDFRFARQELIGRLRKLKPGFTAIPSTGEAGALDYVRDRLLDPRQMLTIGEDTVPSRQELRASLLNAMQRADVITYAFGIFDAKKRTLRHVGMNRGDRSPRAREGGEYQDGALFFHDNDNPKVLTACYFLGTDQPIEPEPAPAHPAPMRDKPVYRPLKVYAFDPSRGKTLGNIMTVQVAYEPLRPGPVGERVSVIDYDLTNDCFYEPVNLDDPAILIRGGLDPSEADPRFHQQMVYAVVNETLRRFEMGYGRRLADTGDVGQYAPYHKLKVYPHAMRNSNAFYSRGAGALLFGYFAAADDTTSPNLPRQTVFTCLSHDVVAHETAHFVLERVRPAYCLPTNFDVPAFHEGFADLLALFHHFSYKEALLQTIQRTGGELHRFRLKADVQPGEGGPVIQSEIGTDNPLVELARQFGDATGMRAALRNALGSRPNTNDYHSTTEPHHQGSILVAAIFDAFFTLYLKRTADLYRIYRAGGGSATPLELPPALAERIASEASHTAEDLFGLCARALHYCPNCDIKFGDFLRALVTAHFELQPDDPLGYRDALMQAFRLRGILPDGVRSFSEDAVRWNSMDLPPCPGLVRQDSRTLERGVQNANRVVLTDYIRANAERLQFEPLGPPRSKSGLHLGAAGDLRAVFYYPLRRIDELGYETDDLFVSIRQTWDYALNRNKPSEGTFHAVGGIVLVFAADGSVRYAINKGNRDRARQDEMREAYPMLTALGLTTNDIKRFGKLPALSFAVTHRSF